MIFGKALSFSISVAAAVGVFGLSTGASAQAAPPQCDAPVCTGTAAPQKLEPQQRAAAPKVVAPATTATNWLTYGFDLARTGYNPDESVLSPHTAGNLNEVWSQDLGGDVSTQPVVASGVSVGSGTANVVYAGSEHGGFYAFDTASGNLLWRQSVGTVQTGCFYTNDAQFGVSSAPVADRSSNTIYVAGGDGNLYALDMSTGNIRPGWPVRIISDPVHEHVWSALTLSGGRLYAPVASTCGDATPYNGRVAAVNVSTRAQLAPFYVVPPSSGRFGGGIWGWGGASTDPSGNLYVASGNALPNGPGEHDFFAEQVTGLSSNLAPFASNYPGLSGGDTDFGATPTLYQAPGCPLRAATVNKHGPLLVYNAGSIQNGPVQRIQIADANNDELVGLPAYSPAQNMLYVSNSSDSSSGTYKHGMLAFKVQPNCTLSLAWQQTVGPSPVAPSPPTVANGVVYYGDGFGNQVFTFDATTGQPLFNSATRITGPIYAASTVANGELFVPSWDHKLHVFDPTGRPFVSAASPNSGSITQTSATVAATLNPNGQATTYHFEYGTTANNYTSQTPSQSAGAGTANQNVTAAVSGLGPNTTYHYRLVATNAGGTTQGADRTFTTSTSAYGDAVLSTPGLSAFWRLGESSGTTAFDSLGNANGIGPATFGYVGSPTLGASGSIQGDPNTAVTFNGQGQYAGVPRNVQDNFSLEFWFKSQGGGSGTGVTQWYQATGLVDGEVAGFVNDFGTSLDKSGQVWAGTGNPDTSIHSQPGLNDGNWHMVTFTRQRSTGQLTLFIDGLTVASGTGGTQSLINSPQLRIGMLQTGATPSLNGAMDEVAAYSTVLGSQTIASHFQQSGRTLPGTCPTGAWNNLGLKGGAVPAFGTNVPSCRAETGRSDLRGGLTSETIGQPFTQLAAAPAADQWYAAVQANNVISPLFVNNTGAAVASAGNNGFLSLEGMRVNTSSSGWSNLSPQNGWHQAPGVITPSYHQDGSFIELRGGLNGGTTGQVIATLPSGLRPAADEWYGVVTANDIVAPLLVQPNGNIILAGGNPGFLALDGLRIPLAGAQPTQLSLQNGWHQAPGVDRVGVAPDGTGFATLYGGANGGSTGQVITTVPSQFAPAQDVWFAVATANNAVAGLVVHPNGTVVLAGGNPGFLSLAGLRIPLGP